MMGQVIGWCLGVPMVVGGLENGILLGLEGPRFTHR